MAGRAADSGDAGGLSSCHSPGRLFLRTSGASWRHWLSRSPVQGDGTYGQSQPRQAMEGGLASYPPDLPGGRVHHHTLYGRTSQGGWNHRPRQIAASRLHTGGERLRHIQVAGHRILEIHEHPARGRVDLVDFPPCNGGTSYASTGGLHGDRTEPASHPNSG